MARKKKPVADVATPVDAIKHTGDSRTNIPTRELADFADKDERAPKTVLYPRDPSLDPQLVWKGKDDLDRGPLEVPAVPIYIQEKIHPQALIEDIRRRANRPTTSSPTSTVWTTSRRRSNSTATTSTGRTA